MRLFIKITKVETQASSIPEHPARKIYSLRPSSAVESANRSSSAPAPQITQTRDALLWSIWITRRAHSQATRKKRLCMYMLTRYNWNSFLYAFFVLVSDYVAPRPGVISGLSLLLALLLAPRGFLWVLRCSSLHKNQSQKSNVSKFQFDLEFEGHGFLSRMTVILIFSLFRCWWTSHYDPGFCVFLTCIYFLHFASFTDVLPLPRSCLSRSNPLHNK